MKTKFDRALIKRDQIKAKLGKAVLLSESSGTVPMWVISQIDRLLHSLKRNELYINTISNYINTISNNGHSTNQGEMLEPLNVWSREAILADCKEFYQAHGDIFNKE